MDSIRDIRLEFLRSGPAHNQLLSPLTPYLALCGADGAVSVNVPFEHAHLLIRLDRLRYEVEGRSIAPSQRMAELRELGEAVGRMLGRIPELVSALRAARTDGSRLVNIQLRISAYELGLLPFEATMVPADSLGSSVPLLLSTLTGMTREIRRGEPLPVAWNRKPKILFAFASPPGLPAVPAQAHLEALRRAIAPWIKIKDDEKDSVAEVRKTLTVLPNASACGIAERCLAEDYTHVHVLAHGAPVPHTEGRRFGVMLRADDGSDDHVVVDGQSLAMALKSMSANGTAKSPPTVVTLAICDSGNAGTVLTPGGSIAHELHAHDIPWVIASQFPLWMRASNIAVEILYRGLLEGSDPRWVLHELRRRLRMELPDTHDWASIVAYAAVAPDLEAQVDAFRSRQVKARMEVLFDRMDELVGADGGDPARRGQPDPTAVDRELKKLCKEIRAAMARWREEKAASQSPKEKAERLGMSAASEKRIAIVYEHFKNQQGRDEAKDRKERDEAYRQSRRFYEEARKVEPSNHWVLTQLLSIAATPALAPDGTPKDPDGGHEGWWRVARQLAEWNLPSLTLRDRVWAHGTLAELELLGAIYGGQGFDTARARRNIEDHCRQLRELSSADAFPVMSTRRQFQRYLDHWGRAEWMDLAEAAVRALSDKAADDGQKENRGPRDEAAGEQGRLRPG